MAAVQVTRHQGCKQEYVVERARTRAVLEALVVAGAFDPSVTRTCPLDRAPEAMRAAEQGRAQGKIVMEVPAACPVRRASWAHGSALHPA